MLPAARAWWGVPVRAEDVRWANGALVANGLAPISWPALLGTITKLGLQTVAAVHASYAGYFWKGTYPFASGSAQIDYDYVAVGLDPYFPTPLYRTLQASPVDTSLYGRTTYAPSASLVGVSVDPANGRVKVERVVSAVSVGRQLSPETVEGQSQGAVAMGIGNVLTETCPLGPDGPGGGRWNLDRYGDAPARHSRAGADRAAAARQRSRECARHRGSGDVPDRAGAAQCAGDGDGAKVQGHAGHAGQDSGGTAMSDPVRMVVNGQPVEAAADDADMNLIDFLHERQDLTGTKLCCGIGVCRACTVGVRNTPDAPMEKTLSCSTPVSAMAGMHVYTIEGTAQDGTLSPLQQSFLESFAFQCGYCASGFLMAATAMLDHLRAQPVPAAELDAMIETCGRQRVPMHRLRQIHRGHPQRGDALHEGGGMTIRTCVAALALLLAASASFAAEGADASCTNTRSSAPTKSARFPRSTATAGRTCRSPSTAACPRGTRHT